MGRLSGSHVSTEGVSSGEDSGGRGAGLARGRQERQGRGMEAGPVLYTFWKTPPPPICRPPPLATPGTVHSPAGPDPDFLA